jgi:N utilization substance protein A
LAVVINEDEHNAKVVVPDHQLSLAIGKEGQNARLAARLTGWRIDIKSESQARQTGFVRDEDYFDMGQGNYDYNYEEGYDDQGYNYDDTYDENYNEGYTEEGGDFNYNNYYDENYEDDAYEGYAENVENKENK